MKTNKQLLRKAIWRYVGVYTIIVPSHILLLLFPLAWILSGFGKWNIKWLFPLWLTLDDTRKDPSRESGLAVDYEIYLKDYKWRWWGVLLWHVKRNQMWNLIEMFKIPKYQGSDGNQRIEILHHYEDRLYRTDKNGNVFMLKQDNKWVIGGALKYVPKNANDDPYQVNRGSIISYITSILGVGYILYKVIDPIVPTEPWVSFRYTSCTKVKHWIHFGGERWLTKFFGSNGNRFSLKWKYQKVVPWGEPNF